MKCDWIEIKPCTIGYPDDHLVFQCSICKRYIALEWDDFDEYFNGSTKTLLDSQPKCKGWKSHGLGDSIAKATRAVGIRPCSGCRKRRERLNRLFPYKPRKGRS